MIKIRFLLSLGILLGAHARAMDEKVQDEEKMGVEDRVLPFNEEAPNLPKINQRLAQRFPRMPEDIRGKLCSIRFLEWGLREDVHTFLASKSYLSDAVIEQTLNVMPYSQLTKVLDCHPQHKKAFFMYHNREALLPAVVSLPASEIRKRHEAIIKENSENHKRFPGLYPAKSGQSRFMGRSYLNRLYGTFDEKSPFMSWDFSCKNCTDNCKKPSQVIGKPVPEGNFAVIDWSDGRTSIVMSKQDKLKLQSLQLKQLKWIADLYRREDLMCQHDEHQTFNSLEISMQQRLQRNYPTLTFQPVPVPVESTQKKSIQKIDSPQTNSSEKKNEMRSFWWDNRYKLAALTLGAAAIGAVTSWVLISKKK